MVYFITMFNVVKIFYDTLCFGAGFVQGTVINDF